VEKWEKIVNMPRVRLGTGQRRGALEPDPERDRERRLQAQFAGQYGQQRLPRLADRVLNVIYDLLNCATLRREEDLDD
jgi:hypothetical protein